MEFSKLQGSGNDFILIDNREGYVYKKIKELDVDLKNFIIELCRQHTGIGADGIIFIEKPENPKNDFKWHFFNADGSIAEMCGNGSRCAVRFCYERGIVNERARFETLAGVIKAEVLEGGKRVKVQLTKPFGIRDVTLNYEGTELKGTFINTGVPHFVVLADDLENTDVLKLGRYIRCHEEFKPAGTNVNFVSPVSEIRIRIRTYERGVEGETLACGTGATASAIVSHIKSAIKGMPVEVETRSGEILKIYFDKNYEEVFLEGGVCKVYEGILSFEIFGRY